jgi:hypothetical protein
MGVLVAFFVGWAVGAKAGPKGFQEVVDAARTVKDSEEFGALLSISRQHAAGALQELGKLLSGESSAPHPGDLLERVQRLTSRTPA